MKQKNIVFIFTIISMLFIASCVKYDFQEPDVADCELDFEFNMALEDFVLLYEGNGITPFLIDTNVIVKGTVIGNDKSGNIYKSFYIQDSTAAGAQTALLVSVNEYETHNKYRVGDMIYIKCQGLYLGYYGGVIQLGGLFEGEIGRIEEPKVDLHIFNACNGIPIKPKLATIDQLNAIPENTLIKINDVQFKLGELDETFADAVENVTTEQFISDCVNKPVMVRTSGFANFAGNTIPQGRGSIIAINGNYNGSPQLTIRDVNEVKMADARCGAIYEKDFEEVTFGHPGGSMVENLTSGNWFSYIVTGITDWVPGYYGGNNYAEASNFLNGANTTSEVWLVSPAFDLNLLSTPIFSFWNAYKYTGPALEVKISTNYSGSGNPTSAIWTNLSPILSPGDFEWTNSGNISLSAYKQANVYIAFVYKGTNSAGSRWEVDDIQLSGN